MERQCNMHNVYRLIIATTDEIEIIGPPVANRRVVSLPLTRAGALPVAPANDQPPLPRIPLGPEPAHLQAVDLESFLAAVGIESSDTGTRRRLRYHGIIHWTFSQKSSEAELIGLGFPIGTARMLCDGIALMEAQIQPIRQ
ncbi:hypothetical protein PTTG_29224 [Puccinia triticina 1-1 BBBD Race 1]|uniref:Uncharacterized protein n=1 Tax=Puccinia triticina (isolate 1-1 / race 1 (BBBD)) TaxID=630390 RepID=A0A180G5J5_PUCT1|nr:hypothetical protein PTTG_29224 [Puccinia triticina 1-1 BBBD Race 1]